MKPVSLISILLVLSLLLAGCEEVEHFLFGEPVQETIPEPVQEEEWQPDRSQPFTLVGTVRDAQSNQPLRAATITATYTLACPTTPCKPFTETIATKTDENGTFTLDLYQHFWDVTVTKTTYGFHTFHLTQEETSTQQILHNNVVLTKGVFKELAGYVRDQGEQIIIDKGSGGFPISIHGRGHYFEYLVVVEENASWYERLRALNNKQVWFKGYVFAAPNKLGMVELVDFRVA